MTIARPIALQLALAGWLQATVLHVDPAHPNANDANPGTEAKPFASLAPALAAAGPDVTIRLAPGIYPGNWEFPVGGTADHPFSITARDPGSAVFDLTGTPNGLRGTGAAHVILDGLVLRNAAQATDRAALEPGTAWKVSRCRIEHCFAGILLDAARANADAFTLEQSVIDGCESFGLLARGSRPRGISGPPGLTVTQTIIRRCQGGRYGAGCYAAGLYARGCSGVTITNSAFYDNGGPGIWLDDASNGFAISNNTIRASHSSPTELGAGIEISDTTAGPNTITGNLILGNTGAGIVLAESRAITVTDNTLLRNGGGIMFRNLFCYNGSTSTFSIPADGTLGDLTLAGNRLGAWTGAAAETWPQSLLTLVNLASNNITLDFTTYDPAAAGVPLFRLLDDLTGNPTAFTPVSLATLPAVQAGTPFEDHGSLAPVPLPPGTAALDPGTAESVRLSDVLATVPVGALHALPVLGHDEVTSNGSGGTTTVYDLADRTMVTLELPTVAALDDLGTRVSRHAMTEPAWLIARRIDATTVRWEPRPWQSWQHANFSPAEIAVTDPLTNPSLPAADPDGDGVLNLLEYALGLNPRQPDSGNATTVRREGGNWVIESAFPAALADLVILPEISGDLRDWQALPPPGGSHETVYDGEVIMHRWRIPTAASGKWFSRCRITLRP